MKKAAILAIVAFLLLPIAISQEANDEQFKKEMETNPSAAFQNNPEKAWATIRDNPNLMTKSDVLDEAFKNNKENAAGVLDTNPSLLIRKNVAERFNQEAIKDVQLLNNNPRATATFLALEPYKIKYQTENNKGAAILGYNGIFITTNRNSFNIHDLQGTTIAPDGGLILPNGERIPEGTIYRNENGDIVVERGTLETGPRRFFSPALLAFNEPQREVSGSDVWSDVPITFRFSGTVTPTPNGVRIGRDTTSTTFTGESMAPENGYVLRTANLPIELVRNSDDCEPGPPCAAISPNGVHVKNVQPSELRVSLALPGQQPRPPENEYSLSIPQASLLKISGSSLSLIEDRGILYVQDLGGGTHAVGINLNEVLARPQTGETEELDWYKEGIATLTAIKSIGEKIANPRFSTGESSDITAGIKLNPQSISRGNLKNSLNQLSFKWNYYFK